MLKIVFAYGLTLALMGVGFYLGTGAESVTALIPSFLAAPVLVCAIAALRPSFRKHAMHAAVVLGVLGTLGGLRGVAPLVRWLAGAEIARPAAALEQTLLSLVSLAFVVLCVRSFVLARKVTNAALPAS